MKAVETEPPLAAPPCPQTDSEMDDESVPARASAKAKVCGLTTGAEDRPPKVTPVAVTAPSLAPAALSGSDGDTDVDESSGPPDGNGVNPADLHMDSDTDVEDEGDVGIATEDQVTSLCRTTTSGFQPPPLQKCSTPLHLPGTQRCLITPIWGCSYQVFFVIDYFIEYFMK